jgi:type IV secretory pathway VirJ component
MIPPISTAVLRGALFVSVLAAPARAAVPSLPADSGDGLGLPVVEVRATGEQGATLAVLLSGDGGWAGGDKAIAKVLAQAGIPVVGLNVPTYLRVARTPDGASADLQRLLQHYLQQWRKERVILIGYSHGANIAPFLVSRLPGELRERISLLALVSLEQRASFRFHVADMVAEMHHAGELAVRPEVEKLKGLPMICMSGEHDRSSLCPLLPAALARFESITGGHRVTGREGDIVGRQILAAATTPSS